MEINYIAHQDFVNLITLKQEKKDISIFLLPRSVVISELAAPKAALFLLLIMSVSPEKILKKIRGV